MFEKLIDAILALVHELKRFNDNSGTTAAVSKTVEKTEAKAEVKKAEKPAPKAAAKEPAPKTEAKLGVADVQKEAGAFIAANGRDEFVKLLKGLGYQNISGAEAADGEEGLKAIFEALKNAAAADPAA